MRLDEATSYLFYAAVDGFRGLLDYSSVNNHLFHTFWMRVSFLCFGNSPIALRLPAFLAGLLVLPATYVAVRSVFNRRAAIIALGLVAVSPPLVVFSTAARGYSLLTLLFLALLALATRLPKCSNALPWLGYAVLGAFAGYTLPVAVYGVGAVGLWLGLQIWFDGETRRAPRLWRWTLTGATMLVLLGVLYLPAVWETPFEKSPWNLAVRLDEGASGRGASSLGLYLQELAAKWHVGLPTWVAVMVGGLALFGALVGHRIRGGVPIGLGVLLWVGPLFLRHGVMVPLRSWIYFLPLYAGLCGAGFHLVVKRLESLPSWPRGTERWFVVVCLAFGGWTAHRDLVLEIREAGRIRGVAEVTDYLERELQPEDRLAVTRFKALFLYEFERRSLAKDSLRADPAASRVFLCRQKNSKRRSEFADKLDRGPKVDPSFAGLLKPFGGHQKFSEILRVFEVGDLELAMAERLSPP